MGSYDHFVKIAVNQAIETVSIMAPKLLGEQGDSGGRLNIKMPSYQYRDSHVKDKTVSSTVLSLTWESPYPGKTVFILRGGPAWKLQQWQNITFPQSSETQLFGLSV